MSGLYIRPDALFFRPLLDRRLIGKLLLKSLLFIIGTYAPVGLASEPDYSAELERYVQQGLENNPALKKREFDLEAEQAFLKSLRAQYKPEVNLNARVSASEGGRTIDFPAGDLLNPVYNALNDQSQAQGNGRPFPTVENQSVPLLREFEQDTRLVMRGPIYAPKLDNQVEAQNSNVGTTQAARALFAEQLEKDLRVAYWQAVQAQAQMQVLQTSLSTLKENQRVNEALYEAGQVTLDEPKRAEAETLSLQVTLERAQLQFQLAKELFNTLRNQPSDSPLILPSHQALVRQIDTLQADLKIKPSNKYPTALRQVESGLASLQSLALAAKAAKKPELGYQVEAGYQGESYSSGPNRGFATASVVMTWSLWDSGRRTAEVSQANAELKAAQEERTALLRNLHLEQLRAKQTLAISLNAIQARELATKAAEESFRISQRKRDAGEISQVEFLNTEQLTTRSRIALIDAICQAYIDHANWQLNNHQIPEIVVVNGGQP
ncbi:MAG: TolC family protein [Limnobacter sp.]|nr:TolC family protein [Limnobacter sp.]